MYPVLFQIGPFSLYSLWLFVTMAFIVGTLSFAKAAKRHRLDLSMLFDHSISIILVTIFMGRLVFFLLNRQIYMPVFRFAYLPQFFYIWDKGLSFWGGLLGFLIMLAIICFKRGENILKWLDRLIVPIGLGIIIANFGQFLDGQSYGTPTNLPWGMAYESINVKYTVPIHPVQIYSIFYVSGILYVLKKIKKHDFFSKDGNRTLVAVALYSFIRIFMEFFRGDDTWEIFNIRIASVICAITFVISGYILLNRAREAKRKPVA